jgi:hypothetical protein
MDKPDEIITAAIAASPAAPERDTSFAARVEYMAARRVSSKASIHRAITGLVFILSAALATIAFELVRETFAAFGSSLLPGVVLTTLGAFMMLLFRAMTQFALDR